MAMGLLGAAASAAGSMASASSQAQTHNYNAAVEKINARHKRQEGHREQEMISRKYDTVEGQQIASASKAGVDVGYGSAALTIFGEGATNRSLDRNAAYITAESQAVAHENKAKQEEAQAKAAKTEGMIGAASSFLSGMGGAMKGGGGGLMINSG
jgi:hypothetical protein